MKPDLTLLALEEWLRKELAWVELERDEKSKAAARAYKRTLKEVELLRQRQRDEAERREEE